MFNNETIAFLRTLNSITNSVVLQYPITVGRTESADIAYKIDLSKYDSEGFENDIGIYNLSAFLNVFNLFDKDRNVSINENVISISDNTTNANFLTSAIDILKQYQFKKEQFDKSEEFPVLLEMDFTSADIKKIRNASSVFKELDNLVLDCSGDETLFTLINTGEFKQSSNSFKFTKDEQSSHKFKINISLETLFKIPGGDYKLRVIYNEGKNAYRVMLTNDNMSLIVSTKPMPMD